MYLERILRKLLVRKPKVQDLPIGKAGEEWACYLYRLRGYKILARNYALYGKKKLGEIDLIAKVGRRLVLVEVKTRTGEQFMDLLETVDWRKQHYLRRMAKLFLQQAQYENYDYQIDVVAILLNPFDNSVKSVKLIENAIEDTD